MAKDALAAHARDELGISEAPARAPDPGGAGIRCRIRRRRRLAARRPRSSRPPRDVVPVVAALVARLPRGARRRRRARRAARTSLKGALRVTFWGAIAMALTAAIGRAFGVAA